MDKFLPGPWFVSRDPRPNMEWNNHVASVKEPHLEVCSMFHTNDEDGNERGEANARLVAAAPTLYEALRQIVAWHDMELASTGAREIPAKLCAPARAALSLVSRRDQ